MATLGLTIKVGLDKNSLKEAQGRLGKFLGTGLKVGGAAAGAALAAVGAAAVAATAETLEFAEASDAAMEGFRRETGLGQKSVEAFRSSATNLFAAGVGEGIDDIAQAMATVNNTMQTGAEETENLTKKALAMRDVFDKDVQESIDANKVLMDEFGLTSDQAFDFMTEGIQRGLDRSGDFLDSIREYGNLFSDAGFSANEMFSIIENGTEGGVLGTDKISDAVKEFVIRANEGNKDLKQGFLDLGLDFETVTEQVSSGRETWADYFQKVISGINQIEDPIKKAQVQAGIFGTMAEDMGVSFTENVGEAFMFFEDGSGRATTSMQDMAGSMDNVIDKNMTIGESWQNLNRQMVVALEPVVRELMPLLSGGIQSASEFLTDAQPIFDEFSADLAQNLGPALESIAESFFRMGKALGLVSEDAEISSGALGALSTILDGVSASVIGVADAIEALASAIEFVAPLWEKIQDISGFNAELNLGGAPFEIREGSPLSFLTNIEEFLGGFQTGGVVPGSPSQGSLAVLHGGEEIANPAEGQAIVIGGEQFAVREAGRLAAAINAQRQRDLQGLVDSLAEMMN